MNPTPRPDDELHDLLQSWEVESRDDPALARKVWARLEGEKPRGWLVVFSRMQILLLRPAMAVAAIALFATIGALAAQWQSASRHDARVTQLASEYAQTIDPILMTQAGSHSGHTP